MSLTVKFKDLAFFISSLVSTQVIWLSLNSVVFLGIRM